MIHTYTKKDAGKRLSKNFTVGEFLCQCGCGQALVDDKLVERLQQIRDHFGEEVIITGPYRCESHNAAVGGVFNSYHMQGKAADITVNVVAPAEVAKYAESIGVKGIGLYEKTDCGDDFVHIDTRTAKSFWYGHAQQPRSTFGGAPKQTFNVEFSTLRRGSEGEEVRALQVMLKGYGYPIVADGIYGAKTENAVMCYQEDNGLTTDGIAGPDTRKAMLGLEGG
mgnify:CR=1 FL=1